MITKLVSTDVLDLTHKGEPPIYVVVDLETTMDGATKFSAHPFCPENRVLCVGLKVFYGLAVFDKVTETVAEAVSFLDGLSFYKSIVLVGHNIKFDTHYLALNGFPMDRVIGLIDTQFEHYLLTGEKQISLDALANYYEVDDKLDTLKEAINGGTNIKDIPYDSLAEYCEHDVKITYDVHKHMIKAMSNKQRALNNVYARYTLGLWMMEFNGLKVDRKKLYAKKMELEQESDMIALELQDIYDKIMPNGLAKTSSPVSAMFLNQLLFNRDIDIKVKVPIGTYTNGKTRYKTEIYQRQLKMGKLTPEDIFPESKELKKYTLTNGLISMDSSVIDRILSHAHTLNPLQRSVLEKVQTVRKIDKLLKTYVQPISQYLQDTRGEYLHPIYNTSTTDTGRSSATNPNVQNFPPEIEELLDRGGDDMMYVSSDWSQLEMWGAAVLSQDGQLIADLVDGVDIHQRTMEQAGSPPGVDRRDVKGINFGTIYGGKPYTLSQQSGVPQPIVKQIQEALWDRYPILKDHYDDSYQLLSRLSPTDTWVKDGHVLNIVEDTSLTGRKYRYKEFVNKWNGNHEFSWPQSCNYPIQGFATGDFHPLFIAVVVYLQQVEMLKTHLFHIERTVHDSLGVRIPIDGTYTTEQLSNIYVDTLSIAKALTLKVLRRWIKRTEEEVYFPRIGLEHKITIGDETYVRTD